MAKLFIEEASLTAIGDAIRAKTGTEDLLSPSGMVAAIEGIETGGGGDIPEEAFVFKGDCSNLFYNNNWSWFISGYGNKITTEDITLTTSMFNASNKLVSIPFKFNFAVTSVSRAVNKMFYNCYGLKNIGALCNMNPSTMEDMFYGCQSLRSVPEFVNLNLSNAQNTTNGPFRGIFAYCFSLRSIPEEFVKQFHNNYSGYYYSPANMFNMCYSLDEIRGLNIYTDKTMASNTFGSCFGGLYRIKELIFATQDDGTPYTMNMKSQTIDLATPVPVGISENPTIVTTLYNSGITADKEVKDDATYAALKNDADWFTCDVNYSRYNRTSAVNTINSLPDVSQGTSNVIKLKGESGAKTDGGAINTLTAEEIAVATAKGWTITFT